MTTPNNTYDVIVIGAGISGRYNLLNKKKEKISLVNLHFARLQCNRYKTASLEMDIDIAPPTRSSELGASHHYA